LSATNKPLSRRPRQRRDLTHHAAKQPPRQVTLGQERPAVTGVREQAGRVLVQVSRFWEKPSRGLAQGLLYRGCLWNSFVVVARLSTLLGLIMMALPRLYLSFAEVRPTLGTAFEDETIRRLYADLAAADFCAQVLAKFPVNLAVLPVVGVSWSDLGEPRLIRDN